MKTRLFFLVVLLLLVAVFYYISTDYYSAGERAGTISKFSERGYVFKTHEGELHEGGFSGETGTLNPRYWLFSVKEDTVVQKLSKALSTGERVTLKYQEKFVKFAWNGDTKYLITDVVFLPKVEPPVYRNYPQQGTPVPEPVVPLSEDSTEVVTEPV